MTMSELIHLPCRSQYHVYQPLPEYQKTCPYILIVCSGPHTHPIPIPMQTPVSVRNSLIDFLKTLSELPNLTARCLIHHPAVQVWLKQQKPELPHPVFVDLHPSLGNMDHLNAYLLQAQASLYPKGTDWAGVLHLKELQDDTVPVCQPYIREVLELELTDDDSRLGDTTPFRLILCILPENSARLVTHGRHIQSDISFKRVSGWLEFELGEYDRSQRKSNFYISQSAF